MEALERENTARLARGGKLRKLPSEWVNRPRLRPHEVALHSDFVQFAKFCGGDPRPTDALAWFEMRGVAPGEREWMAMLFADLVPVLKERVEP